MFWDVLQLHFFTCEQFCIISHIPLMCPNTPHFIITTKLQQFSQLQMVDGSEHSHLLKDIEYYENTNSLFVMCDITHMKLLSKQYCNIRLIIINIWYFWNIFINNTLTPHIPHNTLTLIALQNTYLNCLDTIQSNNDNNKNKRTIFFCPINLVEFMR